MKLSIPRLMIALTLVAGTIGTIRYLDWQQQVETDRAEADAKAAGFTSNADRLEADAAGIKDGPTWQAQASAIRSAKITAELKRQDAEAERKRDPATRMKLSLTNWEKGGFGVVAVVSATVTNDNDFPVKDIRLACSFSGKSGTVLSRQEHTIYDTIKAKSKRSFRDINVGLIDGQSAGAACNLVSAGRL